MTGHQLQGKDFLWLLESATDAMIIVGREGAILVANGAAERLFGYAQGELRGHRIETLLPERFRGAHLAQREGFSAHPHTRPMGAGFDLCGLRRDGTEFPADVSLSPLQTEPGGLVMATVHDITRRKLAEEALARRAAQLAESEARMRAIVETAVDGIIAIDERGLIDSFNPGAERMFGYREAEVKGRNISMLMPSPFREHHDACLARYLDDGEKRIIGIGREVVGLRQDGSTFPMDLAVGEMVLGGRRLFTGIVRDIGERKQAEEQQTRLLRELESANEELKSFAYVVSHDLKAPLRAIGSLADWIATDYTDKLDAEGKEHLRLLVGRVHRMDALIDGILQYSRVGRVREDRIAVDLNPLLHEIIDMLAPPPGVIISMEGTLPTVMVERTRIQQVFQNLLSNAVKYMDKPQGRVTIGCVADGDEWQFSVADNGPGIEERHFERIFQLFQTLAPRDRVESTGVGLALVRKIVEMYHGRVWVESTIGEGSTFFFTLPRTASDENSAIRGEP
jgi:PAS domain S-box-containing protein